MKEDLKQYVTNLLYSAYADGNQKLSTDVFDTWVEEQWTLIDQYFQSLPKSQEAEKSGLSFVDFLTSKAIYTWSEIELIEKLYREYVSLPANKQTVISEMTDDDIEDEEWHQIHDDINEARRIGEIE